MGFRVAVLSPSDESAAPLADVWIKGKLDDLDAASRLADVVDVVTLDTEHVPASVLSHIELVRPVRPSSAVLRTIQDRREQRRFLERVAVPMPRCRPVDSLQSLRDASDSVGFPCVLKTRRSGYDGKGQAVIRHQGELEEAWAKVQRQPSMVEEFVAFDFEISVLLARRPSGDVRFYPPAYNVHRHHVLHATMAPAPISDTLMADAREIAGSIATALDHVGMLAVEMFVVDGNRLLVNEIAPRPHNSGHYTFGACITSQFEQHVRAVLDLPLGDPSLLRPVAMVNLLGDLWAAGEPDWMKVHAYPEAQLHLYGKQAARAGRKMGHLLVTGSEPSEALEVGESLHAALAGGGGSDAQGGSPQPETPAMDRADHSQAYASRRTAVASCSTHWP